jgi:nickel transport system ATP-binding protein
MAAGESLAILGRSGSGKSTLARLLLGLEGPSTGTVRFEGADVASLSSEALKAFRRAVQIVFQDSIGAVNPRRTIEWIVAEPLRHLEDLSARQRARCVVELLASVGIDPVDAVKRPGQMSGGQLQRVCIARALATNPRALILDEAVSNLDILLQGQIIRLIKTIRDRTGMAIVFVTHDLRLVRMLCDRVIVLAEGRIVEDRAVAGQLALESDEGRLLQQAVLPCLPDGLSVSRSTAAARSPIAH